MTVTGTTKPRFQHPGACRASGFTMIELMLVVVILAIISQFAMSSYADNVERGRVATAMTDIRAIESVITKFYVQQSRYPDDLAEAFQSVPGSCPKGKKTYLCDPWYTQYVYRRVEYLPGGICKKCRVDGNMKPLNSDYDLWSNGKDKLTKLQIGKTDVSADDVIRVRNGNQIALGKDL